MIGKKISHYSVTAKLGEGGMGEVYRATDTKLNRDVALKLLPEAFASDAERMARFEREAQLLASLNHPNVASIYGLEEADGVRCLVLELVEGPTLAERIAKGPVPLDEALPLARQVAEALEAAHVNGIVHRDLKPGNIKTTSEGMVKVLDFGLAKAFAGDAAEQDISKSPTLTKAAATQAGVILGTAAYMSPEQARGRGVDKRADIWAFACVLYEMLTGKQAFGGETITDTLAGILKSEPDWNALPPNTPDHIRRLLRRCLEKDPRRRLHDIADAHIDIEEALAGLARPAAAPDTAARRAAAPSLRRSLPWALVALLALTTGILGWKLALSPAPAPHTPVRFTITLPSDERLNAAGVPAVTISPDGSRIAYNAWREGASHLYLRDLGQLEARLIPDTKDATMPFFSPDGQWLGFVADQKLKKVALDGGSAIIVCDSPSLFGASWASDDTIYFTPSYAEGLWRVSAAGGTPEKLTSPDSSTGELGHWWAQLLPDGQNILFTRWLAPVEKARLALLSLDTGEIRNILDGGSFGRYLPTGHLVYLRSETLLAVPFDLSRLQVTGPPAPVLDDVPVHPNNGNSQFAFSSNGSLVYIPASTTNPDRLLLWVDPRGKEQSLVESHRRYSNPSFSPDGRRLAVTIQEENEDVWVHDLARGTFTRLTYGDASEDFPVWTPDGRRLIFYVEETQFNLYWRAADGSGQQEILLHTEFDKYPNSVSPDGKVLAYTEVATKTGADLWVLPLEGERKPDLFLQTPFAETAPMFSPEGNWLAYVSTESGRPEVYVQAYPGPGGKTQISTDGGREPRWSPDGRRLFYRSGDKTMAVSITTRPAFAAGNPQELFDSEYRGGFWATGYDVSPDGRRFVMVRTPEESLPRQLNVILNWFDELRQRVPTDGN